MCVYNEDKWRCVADNQKPPVIMNGSVDVRQPTPPATGFRQ